MKLIRKIALVLLFLCLSGCTATYTVNINKDMLVFENIDIDEKHSIIYSYNTDTDHFIDTQITAIRENDNYDLYNINKKKTGATAERIFLSLEDYRDKSTLLTETFENVAINKNQNIITMKFSPKENFEYFEYDDVYSSTFDEVVFKITLPFNVIDTNAAEIDENTYKWTFNKDEQIGEILISFDSSEIIKKPISIAVYIITSIIILLVVMGVYVYTKYKNNDKVR